MPSRWRRTHSRGQRRSAALGGRRRVRARAREPRRAARRRAAAARARRTARSSRPGSSRVARAARWRSLAPCAIAARESVIGAKVVVLADTSRSMALPQNGKSHARRVRATRRRRARARRRRTRASTCSASATARRSRSRAKRRGGASRARRAAISRRRSARSPTSPRSARRPSSSCPTGASTIRGEDASKAAAPGARPRSEGADPHGRDDHGRAAPTRASARVGRGRGGRARAAAARRSRSAARAASSCDELTVTARELREDGAAGAPRDAASRTSRTARAPSISPSRSSAPARASSRSRSRRRRATRSPRTIAGSLTFNVARERVRVLHVAGRPTNDVRALRQWLKSDASVDVVAFFILRTQTDNAERAPGRSRAHPLPRRRALHASTCRRSTPSSSRTSTRSRTASSDTSRSSRATCSTGGGLIMVGGQNSFVAGGYANTPLADVLPVTLDGSPGATAADVAHVRARRGPTTGAPRRSSRRSATCVGEELPQMPGANVLGDVRPGGARAVVAPDAHDQDAARRCPSSRSAIRATVDRSRSASTARWLARVLASSARARGPRPRRAVGRPARVAHARPTLRARRSSSSPAAACARARVDAPSCTPSVARRPIVDARRDAHATRPADPVRRRAKRVRRSARARRARRFRRSRPAATRRAYARRRRRPRGATSRARPAATSGPTRAPTPSACARSPRRPAGTFHFASDDLDARRCRSPRS